MTAESSPFTFFSPLAGVVPTEVYVAGGASMKLGTAKANFSGEANLPIVQFALLGRIIANNNLITWNPTARTIVTAEAAWTGVIDYSIQLPVYGDTLTVGEIVLTFIESGANTGGPFNVGGGNGAIDNLDVLCANIAQWFNENSQYNMIALSSGYNVLLTATLPGSQGTTREVTSSTENFYGASNPGTDLVYGDLEQAALPAGVAAFPSERGRLIAYFVSGTFDRKMLVWPAGITTRQQQKRALEGTRLRLSGR